MLKIYRAPDGTTWQYEQGKQPQDYVEVKAKQPANKQRRAPKTKGA